MPDWLLLSLCEWIWGKMMQKCGLPWPPINSWRNGGEKSRVNRAAYGFTILIDMANLVDRQRAELELKLKFCAVSIKSFFNFIFKQIDLLIVFPCGFGPQWTDYHLDNVFTIWGISYQSFIITVHVEELTLYWGLECTAIHHVISTHSE